MSVKLQSASGCAVVIRTDATSEGLAYREALRRINRDYPGHGWMVVGIAF